MNLTYSMYFFIVLIVLLGPMVDAEVYTKIIQIGVAGACDGDVL